MIDPNIAASPAASPACGSTCGPACCSDSGSSSESGDSDPHRSGAIAAGVPGSDWISAEAARLATLPAMDLVRAAGVGVGLIDARILELADDQLDTAFLPAANVGAWPARVALGYLADLELRFTTALRRALSEDSPVVEPWDADAAIDAGLYRGPNSDPFDTTLSTGLSTGRLREAPPAPGFLASAHTLRRWTMDVLRALDPVAWDRPLIYPDLADLPGSDGGQTTVRGLVAFHLARVAALSVEISLKVERFLGPMPEEGCGEPGSCGQSSCACRSRAEGA